MAAAGRVFITTTISPGSETNDSRPPRTSRRTAQYQSAPLRVFVVAPASGAGLPRVTSSPQTTAFSRLVRPSPSRTARTNRRGLAVATANAFVPDLANAYENTGARVQRIETMTLEEIFVANVAHSREEEVGV